MESESCKDYGIESGAYAARKATLFRHGRHFVHRRAGCFLVCMFVSRSGAPPSTQRAGGDAHSHCQDVVYGRLTGRSAGQCAGHKTYDPRVGDVGPIPLANTYNHNTY